MIHNDIRKEGVNLQTSANNKLGSTKNFQSAFQNLKSRIKILQNIKSVQIELGYQTCTQRSLGLDVDNQIQLHKPI